MVAGRAGRREADDPARKRQLLAMLARKLGGDWNARPERRRRSSRRSSKRWTTRARGSQGIELAAATARRPLRGRRSMGFAQDAKAARRGRASPRSRRSARSAHAEGREFLDGLVAAVRRASRAPTRSPRPRCGRWPGVRDAASRLADLIAGTRLSARPAPRGAADARPAEGRRRSQVLELAQGRQAARRPEDRGDDARCTPTPDRRRPRRGGQGPAAAEDGRRARRCRRSAS